MNTGNDNEKAGMDGAMRCPGCYRAPAGIVGGDVVILQCERHGHIAIGDTLAQAVDHWNIYIGFIRKAA